MGESRMKLIIVYESSSQQFEGDAAVKINQAFFDAEKKGAEQCTVEVSGENYTFNLKRYLYRYLRAKTPEEF